MATIEDIRQGDFDKLIAEREEIVRKLAKRHCRRAYAHEQADVYQEARLGLILAIKGIREGAIDDHTENPDDNVERYITARVHGQVRNYLASRKRGVLRVDPRTYGKHGGSPISQVNFYAFHFISPSRDYAELHEMLDTIVKTEQERKVLELKSQNQNGEEIGEQLGVTRKRVAQILKQIRERATAYVEKNGPLLVESSMTSHAIRKGNPTGLHTNLSGDIQ